MSKAAYPLELPASIKAELDRAAAAIPLRERFARLRRAHPLPPPTGRAADKAFFDELSGQS
jgi:antitoxin VapB